LEGVVAALGGGAGELVRRDVVAVDGFGDGPVAVELDLLEMGEHRLQPDVITGGSFHVELAGEPGLPEAGLAVPVRSVGVGPVLIHEALPGDHVLLERQERQLRGVIEEVVDLLRHRDPHTRRASQSCEQEHLR